MRSQLVHLACLAGWLPVVCSQTYNPPYDLNSFKSQDVYTRDVAIIGGGSSGTFSAISLKDKGKSVIVIETKARLGGHTETYADPKTGNGIDYGVQIWHNTSIVKNFFARFNVSLIVSGSDADPAHQITDGIYDLRTGKEFSDPRPSQTAVGAAFATYAQQLSKYPRLDDGMFLPEPVPDDLVLPFGHFAKKYGIEALIPIMFQYNAGLGDILTIPTVENMRVWGISLVTAVQQGFLTTANHNNSEVYAKAQAELNNANSLLLRSAVVYSERTDSGVKLVISTQQGLKLVIAKRLLITIPPKVDILRPFDLNEQESSVFTKFLNTGYYTSIVNNTGIPDDLSITNLSPDTPYNIPALPAVYGIVTNPATPGLKTIYYGSPLTNDTYPLPDSAVLTAITATVKKLQTSNPTTFRKTEPYFVVYSSHAPFYLQARAADIKAGIYKDMYALQGLRSTYWTGATWRAHDSSAIWKYTQEEVLPKLLRGL